jgi:hypothetical protein
MHRLEGVENLTRIQPAVGRRPAGRQALGGIVAQQPRPAAPRAAFERGRHAHSDVELDKILRYTKAELLKVCDAELTFRIRPYPSPQFRQSFFEWEQAA